METKIKSMLTRDNLTRNADKLFSPPQRLTLINSIFVFVVIGFIAGTLLKGCGNTFEHDHKTKIDYVKQ
jgi:hypothetical protein